MSIKPYRGSHLFICDRCRLEYSSDKKRKEWNGAIVCVQCWEPRDASDLYRVPAEDTSVPDPRPEPPIVDIDNQYCTATGRSAIAGYAAGGCAIAGLRPSIV